MGANSQSLPNFSPANNASLPGVIREVLAEFARGFECCLPAVVVSYDRTKHEAVVQPAVNIILSGGEQLERVPVAVTVWRFMCGGFLIDLPISTGDTGWLVAADRDTSNVKASKAVAKPNTYETHKYTAGFFIPDKFGSLSLAGEEGRMVFMNAAGPGKISTGARDTKVATAGLTIACSLPTFVGHETATGTITSGTINLPTPKDSTGTNRRGTTSS